MAEWPWKTKFDLLKNKQLGSNYSQLWSQCWWRAFSKLLISCQESRFELAVLELVLIQRVLLIHLDDCLDQNQLLLFQLIWSFLTSSIRWLLHNLPQVMRSLVSWNPQNWPSSSQQGSSIAIPAFSYHQQPSSNTDTHTSLYHNSAGCNWAHTHTTKTISVMAVSVSSSYFHQAVKLSCSWYSDMWELARCFQWWQWA